MKQITVRMYDVYEVFVSVAIQQESGGGREIRTLGGLLTHAGFQDRCIKPLCHPSGDAYINH